MNPDFMIFFRNRNQEGGRLWEMPVDRPQGPDRLTFFSFQHLEPAAYLHTFPRDKADRYPYYLERLKDAIRDAGGGLIVEWKALGGLRHVDIRKIASSNESARKPPSVVFHFDEGCWLECFSFPDETLSLVLAPTEFLILPCDEEGSSNLERFVNNYAPWLPPGYQKQMLAMMRKESFDARVEFLEIVDTRLYSLECRLARLSEAGILPFIRRLPRRLLEAVHPPSRRLDEALSPPSSVQVDSLFPPSRLFFALAGLALAVLLGYAATAAGVLTFARHGQADAMLSNSQPASNAKAASPVLATNPHFLTSIQKPTGPDKQVRK
jgi:hypothetical protein